jgi:lipopolysaccharide export system protein LptA
MKKQIGILLLACALAAGGIVTAGAAEAPTTVRGDVIEYNTKTGVTTATGSVLITQQDGEARAGAAEYNTKTGTGRLTGGVTATKGATSINCDTLVLHDENHVSAIGGASLTTEGRNLRSERVEYYKDREFLETDGSWAQLSMEDGSKLTAGYIGYDVRRGFANAERNVRIVSEARNLTATADKATYSTQQDGVIELVGNATATQDGNTLTGNRLRIVSGNKTAEASGSVKMVYTPKPKPAEAKA